MTLQKPYGPNIEWTTVQEKAQGSLSLTKQGDWVAVLSLPYVVKQQGTMIHSCPDQAFEGSCTVVSPGADQSDPYEATSEAGEPTVPLAPYEASPDMERSPSTPTQRKIRRRAISSRDVSRIAAVSRANTGQHHRSTVDVYSF